VAYDLKVTDFSRTCTGSQRTLEWSRDVIR